MTRLSEATGTIKNFADLIRLKQWSKNILIIIPLITSHQWHDISKWTTLMFVFLSFGLTASATYIINDIIDRDEDANHPWKGTRPITAGKFDIKSATIISIAFWISGLTLSILISSWTFISLLLYSSASLTYTLLLKKLIILDIICLSLFYVFRVYLGGEALNIIISDWLLTFSLFFFSSLATIKRVSDSLNKEKYRGEISNKYKESELNFLSMLGISTAIASVVVFSLYIKSEQALNLYSKPGWLWFVVPILFYWICRLWIDAFRGTIKTDPVIYVFKVVYSYICALLFLVVFIFSQPH